MTEISHNTSYDIKRAECEKWYPLESQNDIRFFYNCLLFHGRIDRLIIDDRLCDINRAPVTPNVKELPDGHSITLFVQIGWVSPIIEFRMENVRAFNFPLMQILSYGVIELKTDGRPYYYDNNNCSVLADRMFWRYHDEAPFDSPSWVIGEV